MGRCGASILRLSGGCGVRVGSGLTGGGRTPIRGRTAKVRRRRFLVTGVTSGGG